MPLTREQAWAIGHLCHALRDDWTAEQVVHHLGKIANRRAGDVALAAIRAALDSAAKFPAVIPTPGSHWSEGVTYDPPRIPKRGDECRRHPGNWANGCHGCATEGREVEPDEAAAPADLPAADNPVALLRALHAQARANTCRHGVPMANCSECPAALAGAKTEGAA